MFPRSSTNDRCLLASFALNALETRSRLSKTVSRYDNALCDFQFALAANDRALGKPSIDIAGVQ
jgi:hypothetical protein